MLCFFAGLAVNLALKVGLYRTYGAVGLATATAVGAWINFALLIVLGVRRDWMRPDAKLIENIAITAFCSGAAAIVAPHLFHAVDLFVRRLHFLRNETRHRADRRDRDRRLPADLYGGVARFSVDP